jgi:hypothetical protein
MIRRLIGLVSLSLVFLLRSGDAVSGPELMSVMIESFSCDTKYVELSLITKDLQSTGGSLTLLKGPELMNPDRSKVGQIRLVLGDADPMSPKTQALAHWRGKLILSREELDAKMAIVGSYEVILNGISLGLLEISDTRMLFQLHSGGSQNACYYGFFP